MPCNIGSSPHSLQYVVGIFRKYQNDFIFNFYDWNSVCLIFHCHCFIFFKICFKFHRKFFFHEILNQFLWIHKLGKSSRGQYITCPQRHFSARCYDGVGTIYDHVSVCLCPSVTSRCSFETAEQIELVCGLAASFHLSHTVSEGKLDTSKNKGTSLWNFFLNSGLEVNFATAYRSSKRVINSARERWMLRAW